MKTKIVLKNRQTKTYLSEDNAWIASGSLARPFESAYHALYFCVSKELEGIDIMFRLGDQQEVRFLRC